MASYGLTLSSEEHPPHRLVEMAAAAEEAGFDFVSISDHFHPWVSEQGHSPFVWSVLGAISQVTSRIEVGVGVSCPTMRIHPAINAHAAATTALLLEGRFVFGVGTGEALNEHVLGHPWPPADVRREMLEEAIDVIRLLWTGDNVTHRGRHYTVEDARLFDLPETPPPLVVSAFGTRAAELAASHGDGLWSTGIRPAVFDAYREAGGMGSVWSQVSVCWDEDRDRASARAHEVWPNTGLPGQLPQELRTVGHVEQATSLVTRGHIEESIPVGPDPDPIVESVEAAVEAGVDHVYIHQIGNPLDGFIEFWADTLRPSLP